MQLWAQAAVDAQELFVHDSSQRQRAERFHACIVDAFAILVLAFEFECEVVCQVSAFMVSTKQPECVRIPDLQRPEIQHTLRGVSAASSRLLRPVTYLNTEITSINVVSEE